MAPRRRAHAYEHSSLRAALHGHADDRRPQWLTDLVGAPEQTYGEFALQIIDGMIATATARIAEAEAATKAQATDATLAATLAMLPADEAITTEIATVRRTIKSARVSCAITTRIAGDRSRGAIVGQLRDAIVDIALEAGLTAREAAMVANVAGLPATHRLEALRARPGKSIDNERTVQRRRKELLESHVAALAKIDQAIADVRARRGAWALLADAVHDQTLAGFNDNRAPLLSTIRNLGGTPARRRRRA